MNPHFHWCAGCWDWVCDCEHCVEPLHFQRKPVDDLRIRSVGYDRLNGRLEIEYTWNEVLQFHPVAPATYWQLLAARPMYLFFDRMAQSRAIRWEYVRTETKRALMMAGITSIILAAFKRGSYSFVGDIDYILRRCTLTAISP